MAAPRAGRDPTRSQPIINHQPTRRQFRTKEARTCSCHPLTSPSHFQLQLHLRPQSQPSSSSRLFSLSRDFYFLAELKEAALPAFTVWRRFSFDPFSLSESRPQNLLSPYVPSSVDRKRCAFSLYLSSSVQQIFIPLGKPFFTHGGFLSLVSLRLRVSLEY
jgi:hypothetical protein